MRVLDANIFLRYLTADDPLKSAASRALLERVHRQEEQATTVEVIIAEVVYVLSSPRLYRLSRQEIRDRLQPLLVVRGLHLEHKGTVLRALDLYASHSRLDFEDALIVAHMERQGLHELISYDRDFDRIPGIVRIEP